MGRTIGAWLKEQDPDAWDAIGRQLNWDNSMHVVKWIVSQPHCDKATAARAFWMAEPGYFACRIAAGEDPATTHGWPIVEIVLRNWKRGFYERSELGWADGERNACIATYRRSVDTVPGAETALDIPPDLYGPFHGREVELGPDQDPTENAEVWDMLKRQHTLIGFRPGSEEWTALREKQAQERRPKGFWSRLFS